ncbi:MAG: nucleotidyltransferase domain-containing protein [Armatimonadia bacterium]
MDQEQLQQLVDAIVEAVQPLQIILFGSAARGQMHPGSDLDILVVMPEGTHRRHTAQYLYRVIRGIKIPFDLVVATPDDLQRHADNPGLIYRDILQEGKTLYAA